MQQHFPSAPLSSSDAASIILLALATFLLVAQLLLGTDPYFAAAVYGTFIVTIGTLRSIGFGSVAGILLSYLVFSYLVVSQLLKTLYAQPGDSNLGAPDTTITVLMLGIIAICVAAVLVSKLLGKRRIISFYLPEATLKNIRNLSFALGLSILLISIHGSDSGSVDPGGFTASVRQFGAIIFLSVIAETWRVLSASEGRRSVSAWLIVVMTGLIVFGFLYNSKKAVADPFVCYLIGSIAYRRYVSRRQLAVAAGALLVGVLVIYPVVHLSRSEREASGRISLALAGKYIDRVLLDPESVYEQWHAEERAPDMSLYALGLDYLGTFDDLLGRFVLIANTDVIVGAVDQDGPYGPDLLRYSFEQTVPTLLDPNKPREDTGDLLTWHYGLREWGLVGYPTIGVFAPSYAALGWAGVAIMPFVLVLVFLFEVQLTGTSGGGNFLGAYFLFEYFHEFAGNDITGFIAADMRNIPIEYAIFLAIVYVSDLILARRLQQAGERRPMLGMSDRRTS